MLMLGTCLFIFILYLFLNRDNKLPSRQSIVSCIAMGAYIYLYHFMPPEMIYIQSTRGSYALEYLAILVFTGILFPKFILTLAGHALFSNLDDKSAKSAVTIVSWLGFSLLWIYLILLKFYILPDITK